MSSMVLYSYSFIITTDGPREPFGLSSLDYPPSTWDIGTRDDNYAYMDPIVFTRGLCQISRKILSDVDLESYKVIY